MTVVSTVDDDADDVILVPESRLHIFPNSIVVHVNPPPLLQSLSKYKYCIKSKLQFIHKLLVSFNKIDNLLIHQLSFPEE